jgi:hypothetical protein
MSDFIWLPFLASDTHASNSFAHAWLASTWLAGGLYRFRSAVAYTEDMSALPVLSTYSV